MNILWEHSATSSNCYKTIKKASILFKLGTNVDWTIAFVTAYSIFFKISCNHGNEGTSQNHYFVMIFPSKLISKYCNFLMDWDRVQGFSALVTRYLKVSLWPFLASQRVKSPEFSWRWGGLPNPFKPPKQKRAHHPSFPLICLFGWGSCRKSVWGLNRAFFSLFEASKERMKRHLFEVMS
jgi:hypothetical protein